MFRNLNNLPLNSTRIPAELKTKLYVYVIKRFIKAKAITKEKCLPIIKKSTSLSSEERVTLWDFATLPAHAAAYNDADFSDFIPPHDLGYYLNKINAAKIFPELLSLADEIRYGMLFIEASLLLPPPPLPEIRRDYFEIALDGERFDLAERILRQKHYEINSANGNGDTVLHRCVLQRQIKQVRFLLGVPGIDFSCLNKQQQSPTTLAMALLHQLKDSSILDVFCEKIKNFSRQIIWKDLKPLMSCATTKDYAEVGRYFLEQGADPDESVTTDKIVMYPLRLALIRENFTFARILLRFGAKIDQDPNDVPLLFKAINEDREPLAPFLIENGAPLNIELQVGKLTTYFLLAYSKKNEKVMDALLRHGYRFQSTDIGHAILWRDQNLLNRILAERQLYLAFYYVAFTCYKSNLPMPSAETQQFFDQALDSMKTIIESTPFLQKAYLLFIAKQIRETLDLLDKITAVSSSQQETTPLESVHPSQSVPDALVPPSRLETKTQITIANERDSTIKHILTLLENAKQRLLQLAPESHIPKKISTITRNYLLSCELNKLQHIQAAVVAWEQNTLRRIAKAAGGLRMGFTEDAPSIPTEPEPAPQYRFFDTPLEQLSGVYPVENATRYSLLFQPELIKDFHKVTVLEQKRFTDLLGQLRVCTIRGSQGIKSLGYQVACEGTINNTFFKGCLTHELKLKAFEHRIFLATLFSDSGGANQQLLLFACLLRHGNEHGKRIPIPEPHRLGTLVLPTKETQLPQPSDQLRPPM
jgi:ankyrin repeat protein